MFFGIQGSPNTQIKKANNQINTDITRPIVSKAILLKPAQFVYPAVYLLKFGWRIPQAH